MNISFSREVCGISRSLG